MHTSSAKPSLKNQTFMLPCLHLHHQPYNLSTIGWESATENVADIIGNTMHHCFFFNAISVFFNLICEVLNPTKRFYFFPPLFHKRTRLGCIVSWWWRQQQATCHHFAPLRKWQFAQPSSRINMDCQILGLYSVNFAIYHKSKSHFAMIELL